LEPQKKKKNCKSIKNPSRKSKKGRGTRRWSTRIKENNAKKKKSWHGSEREYSKIPERGVQKRPKGKLP